MKKIDNPVFNKYLERIEEIGKIQESLAELKIDATEDEIDEIFNSIPQKFFLSKTKFDNFLQAIISNLFGGSKRERTTLLILERMKDTIKKYFIDDEIHLIKIVEPYIFVNEWFFENQFLSVQTIINESQYDFKLAQYFLPEIIENKPILYEKLKSQNPKDFQKSSYFPVTNNETSSTFSKEELNEIKKRRQKQIEVYKSQERDYFAYNLYDPDPLRCSLMSDDIDRFQDIISKNNISVNSLCTPSVYDPAFFPRINFITDEQRSLIEAAALFGSIKIFKFLLLNDARLRPKEIFRRVLFGRSIDIFHLVENFIMKDAVMKKASRRRHRSRRSRKVQSYVDMFMNVAQDECEEEEGGSGGSDDERNGSSEGNKRNDYKSNKRNDDNKNSDDVKNDDGKNNGDNDVKNDDGKNNGDNDVKNDDGKNSDDDVKNDDGNKSNKRNDDGINSDDDVKNDDDKSNKRNDDGINSDDDVKNDDDKSNKRNDDGKNSDDDGGNDNGENNNNYDDDVIFDLWNQIEETFKTLALQQDEAETRHRAEEEEEEYEGDDDDDFDLKSLDSGYSSSSLSDGDEDFIWVLDRSSPTTHHIKQMFRFCMTFAIKYGLDDIVDYLYDNYDSLIDFEINTNIISEREVNFCLKNFRNRLLPIFVNYPNDVDEYENTYLMNAAYFNYTDIVKLLLQIPGIDVNCVNKKNGTTTMSRACDQHSYKTVEILLKSPLFEYTYDVNTDITPFIKAVNHGYVDEMLLLIEAKKKDENKEKLKMLFTDTELKKAFYSALVYNQDEALKIILENFQDFFFFDRSCEIHIELAQTKKSWDSINCLLGILCAKKEFYEDKFKSKNFDCQKLIDKITKIQSAKNKDGDDDSDSDYEDYD